MTSKKITQLTAAGTLDGSEFLEIVQAAASRKTTTQDVADLAAAAVVSILTESGSSIAISGMTAASALAGTEVVAGVQAGLNKKITVQDIADLAATGQTVNTQTGTTYTLVIGDALKYIEFTNGSSITLTIPTNASVAFPIGTSIPFEQAGAGVITVAAAGGVTVNSQGALVSTNGQFSVCGITKKATNTWTLYGNLA